MTATAVSAPQTWTPENKKTLIRMWLQGAEREQIADVLHRSVGAISVQAVRLNLPRRERGNEGKLQMPRPKRKAVMSDEAPPSRLDRRFQPDMRPCIRCRTPFFSSWIGERYCPTCRNSQDVQDGECLF